MQDLVLKMLSPFYLTSRLLTDVQWGQVVLTAKELHGVIPTETKIFSNLNDSI